MQLATKKVVYLLDVIALPTRITQDTLRDFIAAVFSSSDTIKLGHCMFQPMIMHDTLLLLQDMV